MSRLLFILATLFFAGRIGSTIASAQEAVKPADIADRDSRTPIDYRGFVEPIYAIAFAPDGSLVALGNSDEVAVWDAHTRTMQAPIPMKRTVITSLAFSPDSKLLVIASLWYGGKVVVWDIATHTEKVAVDHGANVAALVFSPDGSQFATSGTDRKVRLWTVEGKPVRVLEPFTYRVTGLWWSNDGKHLQCAGGGVYKLLKAVGDREKDGPLPDAPIGTQDLEAMKGSGHWTWSTQGEYTRWNLNNGEVEQRSSLEGGSFNCAFSPNGEALAMVGDGAVVSINSLRTRVFYPADHMRVWRVGNEKADPTLLKMVEIEAATNNLMRRHFFNSVAWSPDGSILAWCGHHQVRLLKPFEPGSEVQPLLTGFPSMAEVFARPKTTDKPDVFRVAYPDTLAFSPVGGRIAVTGELSKNSFRTGYYGAESWGLNK